MQRDMGKYVVVKVADAKQALTPVDFEALCDLSAFVDEFRVSVGKHPMECVVVEADWPEYETVWQMIADRVDGEQQQPMPELSDEQIERRYEKTLNQTLRTQDKATVFKFARAVIAADRELRGVK